jgi:hypothetical protein
MAGGEGLGSGQIPATGFAGGEGQGGEHEGISGYPPVVLGGLEVAGGGLSTGARDGGRREAAAAALRRPGEGGAGLERCSGGRGR